MNIDEACSHAAAPFHATQYACMVKIVSHFDFKSILLPFATSQIGYNLDDIKLLNPMRNSFW